MLDVPLWSWVMLGCVMAAMIAIDLFSHRGDHVDSRRRAVVWSCVWIGVALLFNLYIAIHFGAEAGERFLGAYLLEKSLSIDNLFLFIVIFGALGIPKAEQHRVLTWGVIGALVTRGAFIAVGSVALHRWHALTYVFGAILVVTSLKLLAAPSKGSEKHKLLGWLEKHLPWSPQLDGHKFITRVNLKRVATPLLLALVAIELTDVVFAIDSVPAAFSVTDEPFLIYSSNIFAILGLRALYVVVAGAVADLRYLRFGLAAVLAFSGIKMLASSWLEIPPLVAVGVIVVCIGTSVIASLLARRTPAEAANAEEAILRARRAAGRCEARRAFSISLGLTANSARSGR
ncbi:TerC family protein [soil metagenome]